MKMEINLGQDNVGLVFPYGQISLTQMHKTYGALNINMINFWEQLVVMVSGTI